VDPSKNPAADVLKFQICRSIINNSKDFLTILEDILGEGRQFDYQKYRKRVLDGANNRIRELEELVDRLNIKL
jgi:hypothetical protein